MHIDLRIPGILLKLKKNVGRKNTFGNAPQSAQYSQANYTQKNGNGTQTNIVDLTPWLGEHGAVKVTNSVRSGAGIFTFTLADKIVESVWDSIYTIIEPMDSIEISMAGNAYKYPTPNDMPIMMRGFVSKVSRHEGMGADGKPHRSVTVSGHNYGKLLQMLQVYNLPADPGTSSSAAVTSFPFFTKFGFNAQLMTATGFLQTVFSKLVNPYIASMSENPDGTPNQSSPLIAMGLDLQTNGEQVSLDGVGTWDQGTIHSLISKYCDIGTWREFFVEDRIEGPYAVYRPKPYVDASQAVAAGVFIMNGVTAPTITTISKKSVVSMTSERSDDNVANYFWVTAPRYSETDGNLAQETSYLSAQSANNNTVYVTDYGNVNPLLYGTRKMEAETQMAGSDEVLNGNGLNNPPGGNPNAPSYTQSQTSQLGWINSMRTAMIDLNRDNVVFESGEMSLKGNENILAGTYVQVMDGGLAPSYYAHTVSHEYEAYGNYFTQVEFERGTGFIDRTSISQANISPYWAEMVQGKKTSGGV